MTVADGLAGDIYRIDTTNATAAAVYYPSSDGWYLTPKVGGLTVTLTTVTAMTVTLEASDNDATSWQDVTASALNVTAVPPIDGTATFTAACILDLAGRQGGRFRVKAAKSNAVNRLLGTVYFAASETDAESNANIATILTNTVDIEAKIDTVDTVVDGIDTLLAAVDGKVDTVSSDLATVDGIVDQIVADTEVLIDHIHNPSQVYPTLAAGITVAGGGGAWAEGAKVEIWSAVNAPASPWDIHHINIESVSANDTYELALWTGAGGAEVEYARTRFTRLATQADIQATIQGPVIAAGTRLSATVASASGGDSVVISVQYHTY